MRNKFFIILILTLNIFCFCFKINQTFCANSSLLDLKDSLSKQVEETLNQVDFDEIQSIVDNFDDNQKKMFSIGNLKTKVKEVLNGESSINYESILGGVVSVLFQIVADYLPMFALLISVGILSSILGSLKTKFNEKSIGDIIHFICFCVCIIVVGTIIKGLIINTSSSINSMQKQMSAIFPIILTMMTALGANSSVGVFQPALAIFSNISSKVFSSIIIPIFTLSFCFGVIGNLSNNVKLDKFNSFLSSLFKWLVGILFTIFFAMLSVQGITAGSFDSVSIRTMKFTMSSYVPVLGGYLSQGMDVILASSVLIKNAVGFVGILMLFTSILAPILEIVVVSLLLKVASAILQPLNNERITNFLHTTSKCVLMLSTCLIVVAFMYFIMIGLGMATANII